MTETLAGAAREEKKASPAETVACTAPVERALCGFGKGERAMFGILVVQEEAIVARDLEATLRNTKDLTATLRSQPWRLIWPGTKKYSEDEAAPAPVHKTTRAKPRRAIP